VELTNTFSVDMPAAEAWKVLTDLERIAPCLPGAALSGSDGDTYQGSVKVKVGPVTAEYAGTARFVQKDSAAHRAVIRAEGRDLGGQGNAAATVTAVLRPRGSGTEVSVLTDLALSGRVAQFGRGVIASVSSQLLSQFAERLEAEVAGSQREVAGKGSPHDPAPGTRRAGPAPVTPAAGARDVEPADLLAGARGPLLTRVLPAAAAAVAVVVGLAVVVRRSASARQRAGAPLSGPVVLCLNLPPGSVLSVARGAAASPSDHVR
jgi:carbon monoxide dehydrogenase subunit G